MTKNIYITGITGIAMFFLFFLGGSYFEFVYKLLPQKYDWIFWTGTVISLTLGLLTIKNWFNSQSKTKFSILLLFVANILTSGAMIITGILVISIVIFGFPAQD